MVSAERRQYAIGVVGVEVGLLHCQMGHAICGRRVERGMLIAGRRSSVGCDGRQVVRCGCGGYGMYVRYVLVGKRAGVQCPWRSVSAVRMLWRAAGPGVARCPGVTVSIM